MDELINELKHQNKKAINLPPLSAQDNTDRYYRRATVVQGSTLTMLMEDGGGRKRQDNRNSLKLFLYFHFDSYLISELRNFCVCFDSRLARTASSFGFESY